MGQLTLPQKGPVYVDACALIYCGERMEPYYSCTLPLWNALDSGSAAVATSGLSLLEVLVKPLREGDSQLVALYRELVLGTTGLSCVPLSLPLLENAALLRAKHNLRTPDAIHAASALAAGTNAVRDERSGIQASERTERGDHKRSTCSISRKSIERDMR